MGKLVVLKVDHGDFYQGFSVTLQIGNEDKRHDTEIIGQLPPAPEIPRYYQEWQSIYSRLGSPRRLEAAVEEITHIGDFCQECYRAGDTLGNSLNNWLNSNDFRPVKEKLLEKLSPCDEVRMILQVDENLMRLPWHLWEFFEHYPKAEITFGAQSFEKLDKSIPATNQVRILAILGDSSGIDIEQDRALLEELPNAEIVFLVEPQCSEINEELWERNWNILFFAGHSRTEDRTGDICINHRESFNLSELKNSLRIAIKRGLKLAIFNSCDGLGLAQQLADLQIPQIIVMREAIPDRVAQEFLKYFLKAFSQGELSYLAVRYARERLQEIEKYFPCASWLPVIFQHPAEAPLTWKMLGEQSNKTSIPLGCSVKFLSTFLGLFSLTIVISWSCGIEVSKQIFPSPNLHQTASTEKISSAISLLRKLPTPEMESVDAQFRLQYTIDGFFYEAFLQMKGNSGKMQTKFWDRNKNEWKTVEQTMELKESDSGLVLLENQTYNQFTTSLPSKFKLGIYPDGSSNCKACDSTGRCFDVEVEKLSNNNH